MENNSINTREKNRDVFGKKTNRWPVFIVAAVLVLAVVIVHFVIDSKQNKEKKQIEADIQTTLNKIAALSRTQVIENIETGKFQSALPQENVYSTHNINEEIRTYVLYAGISDSDTGFSLSTELSATCPVEGVASNVYCGMTSLMVTADKKESIITLLDSLYTAERYFYISDINIDTNSTTYVMSAVIYTFYVVG